MSATGSALLDDAATATRAAAEARETADRTGPSDASAALLSSALRRQAAERVAMHRSRRVRSDAETGAGHFTAPRNARAAKIAAAVAERYARTQSYRDFLAAEAERAVQQAHAVAEAVPATSVPQMGYESTVAPLLWAELEPEANQASMEPGAERRRFQPPQPHKSQPRRRQARRESQEASEVAAATAASGAPDRAHALAAGITIRLYQDESGATRVTLDPPAAPSISLPMAARLAEAHADEEARLLDEEIAFRQEPVFEEPAGPAEVLPANLIEFPRQLVATRKARPRLAEGPLRAEAEDAPGAGQLRIFEVEPAQIAVTPTGDTEAGAAHTAQWSSILLDSRPQAEVPAPAAVRDEGPASDAAAAQTASRRLLDAASVQRRMAAAGINAAILAAAFAAFATVFLWAVAHTAMHGAVVPFTTDAARMFAGRAAIESALPFAACAFALLTAIYQALFFTLSTATPGMRLARIALCTFSDENPTRRAVRRRLPALLLSALPMGFGFLWATLDEERLTWHDRICGMYLRSY